MLNYARLDSTPISWDPAGNIFLSRHYLKMIHDGELINIFTKPYIYYYPPLSHLLFTYFDQISANEKVATLMFNYFLITLLLVCLYLYTHLVYGKFKASAVLFLATTILLTSTLNAQIGMLNLTDFYLDLPMCVFVMIALMYILCSIFKNDFSIKSSIFLSILVSLATMTKWSAWGFLLVPLVVFISKALVSKLSNVFSLLILISMLFVLNYWYFVNFDQLISDVVMGGVAKALYVNREFNFSNADLYYYFAIMMSSLKEFLLFIICLIFYRLFSHNKLFEKKKRKLLEIDLIYLFTILFAILIVVFTPARDPRYFLPITIMILIFLSLKLCDLRRRLVKPLLFSVIIISLIRVIWFTPLPHEQKDFAFYEFNVLSEKYKILEPNIFFEDDSEFFNYANVPLRLEKLGYYFSVININSTDDISTMKGDCILTSSNYLFVYENKDMNKLKPDYHVDFRNYCINTELFRNCILTEKLTPNNFETLGLYNCPKIES